MKVVPRNGGQMCPPTGVLLCRCPCVFFDGWLTPLLISCASGWLPGVRLLMLGLFLAWLSLWVPVGRDSLLYVFLVRLDPQPHLLCLACLGVCIPLFCVLAWACGADVRSVVFDRPGFGCLSSCDRELIGNLSRQRAQVAKQQVQHG